MYVGIGIPWLLQSLHNNVHLHEVRGSVCRLGILAHAIFCHIRALPSGGGSAQIHFWRRVGRPSQVGVGVLGLFHVPVAHFCRVLVSEKLSFVVKILPFLC